MGHHLTNELKFKSDKYKWCPEGFFALKFTDPRAQAAIEYYARNMVTDGEQDEELAEDLVSAVCAAKQEHRIKDLSEKIETLQYLNHQLNLKKAEFIKVMFQCKDRLSLDDGYVARVDETIKILKESLLKKDYLGKDHSDGD